MNPTVALVVVTPLGLAALSGGEALLTFFEARNAVRVFPLGIWEGDVPPEGEQLSRIFALSPLAGETVEDVLLSLGRFRGSSLVGAAWPQPAMGMQPAAPPTQQGYLYRPLQGPTGNPNPFQRKWGVGVGSLPETPVAMGKGATVYVIERGWDRSGITDSMSPDDMPEPTLLLPGSDAPADRQHGTRNLSILAMRRDNQVFGWGIAPSASYRLLGAPYQPNIPLPLYRALVKVFNLAQGGEILLIEEQIVAQTIGDPSDQRGGPVTLDPIVRVLLSMILGKKVVPIIPTGNGSADIGTLEFIKTPSAVLFGLPFVNDLPVIHVGGVSPLDSRRGMESNFGADVRTCAWSSNVYALQVDIEPVLGTPETVAVYDHGGTSAAAAIIAGVAAVAQAMNLSKGNAPLMVATMLSLLEGGATPTAQPQADQIGTMPNLAAIKTALNYP